MNPIVVPGKNSAQDCTVGESFLPDHIYVHQAATALLLIPVDSIEPLCEALRRTKAEIDFLRNKNANRHG